MSKKKVAKKKAAPAVDPKWKYKESDIAKYLNIPKSALEKLRKRDIHPLPPTLYHLHKVGKGHQAFYDESGFGVICSHLDLTPADMRKVMAEKEIIDREGTVWAIVKNNRLPSGCGVQAQVCETDEIIIVQVGNKHSDAAVQYKPGRTIRVRDINNGIGYLVERGKGNLKYQQKEEDEQ
jgi:hypothetical protein